MDYALLTDAELYEIIGNAFGSGLALGLLIGLFLGVLLVLIVRDINIKNFKTWYLQFDDKGKEAIKTKLDDLEKICDSLSKSNVKIFRDIYNLVIRINHKLKHKQNQP